LQPPQLQQWQQQPQYAPHPSLPSSTIIGGTADARETAREREKLMLKQQVFIVV
jgi:hypothetical protein